MTLLGLTGGKSMLVAAMEIGCALLLLFPPLRSLAALIVSAHMGGAILRECHRRVDQVGTGIPAIASRSSSRLA
jgi:hypothetical protein